MKRAKTVSSSLHYSEEKLQTYTRSATTTTTSQHDFGDGGEVVEEMKMVVEEEGEEEGGGGLVEAQVDGVEELLSSIDYEKLVHTCSSEKELSKK